MADEIPFLARPETAAAINRLADADRLTIVVGAGVSAEIGHPTWAALLMDLLSVAAGRVGLEAGSDEAARFAEWTVRQEGALGAAEVARALLGERCDREIQRLLYRDVATGGLPGPSADAIARIQQLVGGRCEIVTTNYDVGVENALRALGVPHKTLTGPDDAPSTHAAVRHLHGIVRRSGRVPAGIVLSQRDYDSFDRTSWQYRLLVDRLGTSTCLFVGSGMSDPHLLHYLHRAPAPGPAPHVALIPRQAEAWFDSDAPLAVRVARERSLTARWRAVGVEALRPDYFVQSAQFLFEVLHRIAAGPAAQPYATRLDRWTAAMEPLVAPADRALFARVQDALTAEVTRWLDGVRARLAKDPRRNPDERLGLHLWARRPSDRALFLWASSDRSWRDPLTIEPVKISLPAEWTSIRTFCRGTPLVDVNRTPTSRWNTLRGVPVTLRDDTTRLPVGVLTLASTAPDRQSALVKADADVVEDIHQYLEANAAQLMTPIG